ncbi:Kinesin heavy chain-like protein 3 [Elsinoe fawcettii]|nr:Kinesin heavy chain-like protein 3 [Elsinoe fawcettii]
MYTFLRIRAQQTVLDVIEILEEMALTEIAANRGLPSERYSYVSTASTPSMRARDADMVDSRPSTPDGGNSVKVVVRVRKFLQRELDRSAPCIVEMNPVSQQTILHPPPLTQTEAKASRKTYEEKSFTFDKSFWSHDVESGHYAHQKDVYASFGEEFLDHNFDGYHTCIFAYGQTGSGKSYTMMGTPEQPGLIPRTCEGLFERIHDEQNGNITYNVHVSYFEVYNEHVRDLLTPRTNPPTYLKIRESKADGVYVQGLTDSPVKSYAEVEKLMKAGDQNRTTASTKMNDTSSRSHAVFTLTLKQIQHDVASDSTIERLARMRLVDLAGSERANRTEATGARLREGSNINQSLTTLGRVIAALAEPKRQRALQAKGPANQTKRRLDVVPYRDSVLTWLLKDSLGGNSKTAMVACISPTDYEETLSTLRYADQAKKIRTRAHVNQDAVSAAERDAKILEMQETIRSLQFCMNAAATRKRDEADRATEELENYQREVIKMQRAMEESKAVSDVKIRTMTQELEELRPLADSLQTEVDSLRRHLALALGELKNPIVIPKAEEKENYYATDDETEYAETEYASDEDDGYESAPQDWQLDVDDLMKELGMFKRRVADDHVRFNMEQQASPV